MAHKSRRRVFESEYQTNATADEKILTDIRGSEFFKFDSRDQYLCSLRYSVEVSIYSNEDYSLIRTKEFDRSCYGSFTDLAFQPATGNLIICDYIFGVHVVCRDTLQKLYAIKSPKINEMHHYDLMGMRLVCCDRRSRIYVNKDLRNHSVIQIFDEKGIYLNEIKQNHVPTLRPHRTSMCTHESTLYIAKYKSIFAHTSGIVQYEMNYIIRDINCANNILYVASGYIIYAYDVRNMKKICEYYTSLDALIDSICITDASMYITDIRKNVHIMDF
jgi:hypothetical protein